MLLSQKQNNRPRVVHGREAKQTPSAARKENVLFQPRRKLHRQRGRMAQLFQITPTGIWRRWVAQRSTKIRPTPAIPLKSFQASGGKRSKTFMTNKTSRRLLVHNRPRAEPQDRKRGRRKRNHTELRETRIIVKILKVLRIDGSSAAEIDNTTAAGSTALDPSSTAIGLSAGSTPQSLNIHVKVLQSSAPRR